MRPRFARGAHHFYKIFPKDNGFEPIQWKYECQGLHLSESTTQKGCKCGKMGANHTKTPQNHPICYILRPK